MSQFVPPEPTGSNREASFMQWLLRTLKIKLRNSASVSWDFTENGIFANVRLPKVTPSVATTATSDWYTFIRAFGNYIVCRSSSGAIVPIAKPFDLWNSIVTQHIQGQRIDYTYPHNGNVNDPLAYVYRQALPNPNPQNIGVTVHIVTPPYLATSTNGSPDSKIKASPVKTPLGITLDPLDVLTPAGTAITLMEDSARAWTFSANQNL